VRRSTRLATVTVAVTFAGMLGAGLGVSHRHNDNAVSGDFAALPVAPPPALNIGAPERLSSGRHLSRWTIVRKPTIARAEPSARSAGVAELATLTPEGTPSALTALRARTDANGRLWIAVRLPVLPNGSVGWVPRQSLGAYQSVNTRLVVDRKRLRAILYRAGRVIFTAPVGVGAPAWPTPAGEFTVRSELTRYASPFYGPVAFGTTARSAVLTDWPDGGFIGIHGTNDPRLIPGRISHGCIRLRNTDILRLAALMPVGTPLTIR
jgi:hypothetical protein